MRSILNKGLSFFLLMIAVVGVNAQTQQVSYTKLDYSDAILTDGTPKSGSVTMNDINVLHLFSSWSGPTTGKGFNFTAEAGKTYRIACIMTSELSGFSPVFYLLNSGTLRGDDSDLIHFFYPRTPTTYYHTAEVSGNVRILICDYYNLIDFDYTIAIREMNEYIPSYTELPYFDNPVVINDIPKEDSFTEQDNLFTRGSSIVSGKGYSFKPETDKRYRITCGNGSPNLKFLTGIGALGSSDDEIFVSPSFTDSAGIHYYFMGGDGSDVRLLLYNSNPSDLNYTISIKEDDIPLYTEIEAQHLDFNVSKNDTLTRNDLMLYYYDSWGLSVQLGKKYRFVPEDGKRYKLTLETEIPELLVEMLQGDSVLNPVNGYFNGNGSEITLLLHRFNDAAFGGFNNSYTLTIEEIVEQTIVEKHGLLKVKGSQVVNKDEEKISLFGNSLYWSVWGGENYYNANVVNYLKYDWNTSIVRAAMAVDVKDNWWSGYIYNKMEQTNHVKAVVDACIAEGLYVIIDFHTHDVHKNDAVAFFTEMAILYGEYDHVIYEIFNEPDNESWSTIKDYAKEVIAAIRKIDPDNLVVVGTPNWSQFVDEASLDPIDDVNVAYTLHFYADTHKQDLRDRAETAMNNGIALFVTEWGTCNHLAAGTVNKEESDKWLKFCRENGISLCNWSVSHIPETASALVYESTFGGWTESDYTASGKYVRNLMREWGENVSVNSLANNLSQIYPNPVRQGDFLYVSSESAFNQIRITDLRGVAVYTQSVVNGVSALSVSTVGLPEGIYLLELVSEQNREVYKVVVK